MIEEALYQTTLVEGYWLPAVDGDPRARYLFRRHYSYRPYADGRNPRLFVGPGEKMVLMTLPCDALFVWRKFIDQGQLEWMRNNADAAVQQNHLMHLGKIEPDQMGVSPTAKSASQDRTPNITRGAQPRSALASSIITGITGTASSQTDDLPNLDKRRTLNAGSGMPGIQPTIENKAGSKQPNISTKFFDIEVPGDENTRNDCSLIDAIDGQRSREERLAVLNGQHCSNNLGINVSDAEQRTTSPLTTSFLLPEEEGILSRMPRFSAAAAMREKGPDDIPYGICCAVFRNESPILSSWLIREAMQLAWARWPGQRLYTYVNAKKLREVNHNPGCCFLKAGWRRCGVSKSKGLLIFEALP